MVTLMMSGGARRLAPWATWHWQNPIGEVSIELHKPTQMRGRASSLIDLPFRTIAKLLGSDQVTLINTPSIMQKYLGESEKALRQYFAPAEEAVARLGEASPTYVLIFDEIDAIFRERGSGDGSSASLAYDSVVNSLLTLMDGLKEQNNIIVIGMTNQRGLIDKALLRPGRFEVQVEIALPDVTALAFRTGRFSGAEIAGLVRNAASLAIARAEEAGAPLLDHGKLNRVYQQVQQTDFLKSIDASEPAFTTPTHTIARDYLPMGWMRTRKANEQVLHTLQEHIATSTSPEASTSDALRILITGAGGVSLRMHLLGLLFCQGLKFYVFLWHLRLCLDITTGVGKTALAVVTGAELVGLTDLGKVNRIRRAFTSAHAARTAVVLLDDLDTIVEYLHIANQAVFSHALASSLQALLASKPPPSCKLVVLATRTAMPSHSGLLPSTAFDLKNLLRVQSQAATAGWQSERTVLPPWSGGRRYMSNSWQLKVWTWATMKLVLALVVVAGQLAWVYATMIRPRVK
ncbi:uncharacterized protein MONBRDRAFT_22669 [Monosiga brevicollis MX1]|uniref:Vesicle-fusing ATPase n=1 Tax=Monosiga brevicollis TaxID=81824 RepID=A9URQ0_MONBE|nr:uncharacterized protein MONBRDRAFT_22669 [Monosiga brevicollis MX1]EDQ91965.1 predicted protein [Monosiga brevicollis MX1]|eukprot:XP_001743251.1 hypothetical protein [Monosiga brevicollis MX1]